MVCAVTGHAHAARTTAVIKRAPKGLFMVNDLLSEAEASLIRVR
jgi:hypothetical protein